MRNRLIHRKRSRYSVKYTGSATIDMNQSKAKIINSQKFGNTELLFTNKLRPLREKGAQTNNS